MTTVADLPFFGSPAWDAAQADKARREADREARRAKRSRPESPQDHGLPFTPSEAAESVPEPVSQPVVPEPRKEAPRGTEKPSGPVRATQEEPSGPFGLKERREWLNKVSKTFKGQHRIFHVATAYALRAHGKDRTVYAGSALIAEETDIAERHVKTERARLTEAGLLVDTGKRQGRAIVYRLV